MDTEFSQMSSRYLYAISQFRGLLKQRNEYLKQLKYGSQVDQVLLEVLSDQLAESGAAVTAMRFKLLKRLETWSAQLHEH
ncbi:DNA replication and repair protein RecF, partial [[Eubacterium] rectale]|nr:DNA replication and repair protein RecF [Agathobacter rectalis]